MENEGVGPFDMRMSATKVSGVLAMEMETRLGDDQADRLRLSIKTRAAD